MATVASDGAGVRAAVSGLTVADAARIMREAVKDKSYRAFPIGGEAGHYIRWKRGRLTEKSYRDYESCLDKLARYFADLELKDLEPPVGSERLEEFLDYQWGDQSERTYNKNLSMIRDFFKWAVKKGKLHGDPTTVLERRKTRGVERTVFSESDVAGIIAAQPELRDRIALRILFHTGIRKGGLRLLQFKHFDYERRRLTVRGKGGEFLQVPLVDPHFWTDLERHVLEWGAHPEDYLLAAQKSIWRGYDRKSGASVSEMVEFRVRLDKEGPTAMPRPMSEHGVHDWWYGCLERAGVVARGQRSGERMHKTRHTAGQILLDKTDGNLKAVQKLLHHKSIKTTGDVYTDWDLSQLEAVMREALLEDE
jgi:site-specific recombinase XerD